ncbi:DUF4910 domain-containing protein [Streptosporangium sandarakinum]|uniref:DUF4910 domain-containing protein n=1 Tax=Streptosporangium sandarakinum TaxID=1260955 RepID=UPI003720A5ED
MTGPGAAGDVGGTTGLAHARFDVGAAERDVAELCRFDRYQASDGIMAAAAYVAERAERAGLSDVRLLEFPADGGRHWWTFRAPSSWTPVHAELAGVAAYPDRPFTLAAYSAPTGPDGVEAPVVRLGAGPGTTRGVPLESTRGAPGPARGAGTAHDDPERLRGAIAVHDDPDLPLPAALDLAARYGALGLATDRVSGPGRTGRIELRAGGPLLAFSLTPGQLADLAGRDRVRVTVRTHGAAPMPVVTALLPGEPREPGDPAAAEEVLLSAHLCHPRPSANDNASGVAALLGAAAVLAGVRRGRRAVRFVWGPEFTGMAAYLHDVAPAPPVAAVNVDMAGQDQRLCGGPLIVERSPDHLPGFVNALAEYVVGALPQAGRSYSGAVACDTWAWRATPFVGASDHSLLVDRSVGCPTVTLGHWPDRFNHSSADTLDKVDFQELRRTATIACATAAVLAAAGEEDRGELERIATRWAAARLLECLPRPGAPPADLAADRARGLLRHRTAVALGALDGVDRLCGRPGDPGPRRWVEGLSAHVAGLLPGTRSEPAPAGPGSLGRTRPETVPVGRVRPEPWASGAEPGTPEPVGPPLRRTWEGPFNLRGLAEAASPAGRDWIDGRLAADRSRAYALMLALAHGVDGTRDRAELARYAEYAAELPVGTDFADGFLSVLVEAGWAEETTTAERGADAQAPA